MPVSRFLWPLLVAGLTACSGNLGGGQSTLPGAPLGTNSVQQAPLPAPTASPVSASLVASVGDSLDAQPLPSIMGWGGTIAFTKPVPSPSASPNAKQSAVPDAGPISVGVTAAVVEPADAPHFAAAAKGKGVSKGLLYVSLLPTADLTLAQYPKIAVDVPRDTVAKYRDRPFALALYDPETKEKTYRLAVAERDLASPAPSPSSPATATPAPVISMNPGQMQNPTALTPPPVGSALGDAMLPPERIAFLPTASTLVLRANRPVVFVVYAAPAASPQPSAKPSAGSSPAPAPSSSPSPAPRVSPTAVPSPA